MSERNDAVNRRQMLKVLASSERFVAQLAQHGLALLEIFAGARILVVSGQEVAQDG